MFGGLILWGIFPFFFFLVVVDWGFLVCLFVYLLGGLAFFYGWLVLFLSKYQIVVETAKSL